MDDNIFLTMDDMEVPMDTENVNMLDSGFPFLQTMMDPSSGNNVSNSRLHSQTPGIAPSVMEQMQQLHLQSASRTGMNNSNRNAMPNSTPIQRQPPSTLFEAYASQFGLNKNNNAQNPMSMVNNTMESLDNNSVEAYAALMGIKLDSPEKLPHTFSPGVARAQINAQQFENMMKMQTAPNSIMNENVTSMTLPAGVGSGLQPSNNIYDAMAVPTIRVGGSPTAFESQTLKQDHIHRPPLHFTPSSVSVSNNFAGIDNSGNNSVNGGNNSSNRNSTSGGIGSQTLSPEILSSMIRNNLQNSNDVTSLSYSSAWNASEFDYSDKDAQVKADKSRERNRDHSRKSRLRKKAYIEGLKYDVKHLQIYKELCEQNPDLLALISIEPSKMFLFVSSAYGRILGYQEKQIIIGSTSFYDLMHQDDKAKMKSEFQALSRYQDINIRYRVKHSSGRYLEASTSAHMSEQGIICTTRIQKENSNGGVMKKEPSEVENQQP